ncbi:MULTISPECIES: hypothetical protein [unclassified Wenzhouxiangella]|uniref:HvfA family oxazolone/thioamide-modified RiPP metallophore n=1 Tax=unclassified Wenzhouxiangella TaxID=2613841 RepID=UPI000E327AE4|nr:MULTISPECIES: hypothetical protein [unclassified Wenzhouxiangella]RFF28937.1 hypothetical protein DZK25_00065 [Wenzhouxiangella sp. 15181]RFP68354.1 hypothetical protein DZK26_08990 [Wenzhouxiangella sp. 15190]
MTDKKYLLTAISTVAAASFSLSAMASQDTGVDPFQAEDLPAGFQVSADDDKEGKCGEDKDKEGSCGEGSCGEDKDKEGSCGEDSGDDKDEEGSCGEGSCGSV